MIIVRNKNYYNKISHSCLTLIFTLVVCVFLACVLLYDYNSQFRFSVKSGFYDNPFELKIYGQKNYDIYYTLDGSTPTLSSPQYYGESIQINDRTTEPNYYSKIEDVSTGFYTERVEAYSYNAAAPGYITPQYNVDKCTIIRAAKLNGLGEIIEEISGVYFIGKNLKEKYDDIMVIALMGNYDDFFDYYEGIYVAGADFGRYLYKCETEFGYDSRWWSSYWYMWPANYRRTGIESERPARIEIFDNKHDILTSQTYGIRIKGAGSRGKLPRSLRIYSREAYSGSRLFQTDLLGNGADLHKYVIFSGADDNIFKIKDYLANTMESKLNFATMDFKPCVCFIDGEYWGSYYLTEDYDADYIQSHYNVPRDNGVIWQEGEIEEGYDEDLALYTDMEAFISENDMTLEENYKKACEMIDIDSFADYYAAQIFIARCGDWPNGNIAAWRSRGINLESKYQDGRWRWMLFDVNSEDGGLDNNQLEDDTVGITMSTSGMFASLIKNESFKQLFCQRLLYIENNIYSEERVNEFIDNYYEQMLEMLCQSNMRFYGDERRDEIISNAENIRTFLLNRHTYIDNSIKEHFGEEYLK